MTRPALLALTAATLLGAGSGLPSPAHARELPEVTEFTFEVRAVNDVGPGVPAPAGCGVMTPYTGLSLCAEMFELSLATQAES